MAGAYEHLLITKEVHLTPRRRRNGFGSSVTRDDRQAHGRVLQNQATALQETLSSQLGGSPTRNVIKLRTAEKVNLEDISKHGISLIGQEDDTIYLAFGSEQELNEFSSKLSSLAAGEQVTYVQILLAIDQIDAWGYEDRKSWALRHIGLPDSESFYLDVELWPIGLSNDAERLQIKSDFSSWLTTEGIAQKDCVNRDSLLLYRVSVNSDQVDLLLNHKDIRQVDLPPRYGVQFQHLHVDINDIPIEIQEPSENSAKVCILDSGLNSNHPLLKGAVGDAQSFVSDVGADDDHGHGTAVAGVALYGDIEERIDANDWSREIWLLSGKILKADENGDPVFDEMTIETSITNAITYFHDNYGCRVFNLSIGNSNAPFLHKHISGIAVTIDELARNLDIIIIVSAGNFNGSDNLRDWKEEYPSYLFDEKAALIDPAPAVNSLTIGSISKHTLTFNERRYGQRGEINEIHVANEGQISPFSRCSQDDKAPFKPELVAHGGNFAVNIRQENDQHRQIHRGLGVVTLNHQFNTSTIFKEFCGTSFAAPYISHLSARLLNSYPNASANLIRAILVNNARISATLGNTFTNNKQLRRVAGYGEVDEESLFKSSEEHVVLIAEDSIENDKHQFFEIPLPSDFFRIGRATRTVTVTLAYSPAVKTTRIEYVASKMKYHLIDAESLEQVVDSFNNDNRQGTDSISEADSQKRNITQDDRSRGTVQSSSWTYKQFNRPRKLFLVVTRQDQVWANDLVKQFEPYAVAISITDYENEQAQLYQQISAKLRAKARTQQRTRVG
jgi:subtilisin family serine protease